MKTDGIINQGKEIMLRLDSFGHVIQDQLQQFAQQQETRDAKLKADMQAAIMNGLKVVLDAYEKNTEDLRQDNKDLRQSTSLYSLLRGIWDRVLTR